MPPQNLFSVKDPATRSVLKKLWDQLDLLQGATSAAAWRGSVNAGAHPLTNLADGVEDSDAVTVAQLAEATDPQRFQQALAIDGVAPLNVTGLPGAQTTTVLYGTDATMRATPPDTYADGTLFIQTDRKMIYENQLVSGLPTWVLVMARPDRDGSLYSNLGTNDAGATAFLSTEGYTARWSGANWNFYLGSRVNTFALRPSLALADRGFLFIASDYGYHVWRKMDTPNDWLLMEGMGGPMYGTAADRATVAGTLGANDVGFTYVTTDQGSQLWRWDGTAFVLIEGVGGPMRDVAANRPATLGTDDAGFHFFATDTNVTSRWSGAAWANVVQGLASGGTNADLSATGGASRVLKQTSAGAAITVAQLASTDISDLASGTYTPTLTNVANVDASTPSQCQYLRVGSVVTVSGKVDIDIAAAATNTQLAISLPIASDFTANTDCCGVAAASDSVSLSAAIRADSVNNRAEIRYISTADVASVQLFFTFTYQILA